jgi:hypothetical protein
MRLQHDEFAQRCHRDGPWAGFRVARSPSNGLPGVLAHRDPRDYGRGAISPSQIFTRINT